MYGLVAASFHLCKAPFHCFSPPYCYHFHIESYAHSCHGPAIYPGVIDPSTNKSIIHGKTITGFTTEGEDVMEIMDIVRGWGEPLIDEWAERLGAKCEALACYREFRKER